MNRTFLVTSSALLLALAPVAQETSSGSALTIRTTDSRMARNAMRSFDSPSEMPVIEAGQAIVLTLDDGGQMVASKGEAKGWLHVVARPPALMQTFATQIQQGRGMAQMMAGMGLGEAGFDSKQINTMIDAAFSFPEQIETLEVHLAEEPEDGADVHVSLVPVADSWLGGMVAALAPNPRGVKQLDNDGAMVEGAISVDMPKLAPSLLPMMKFFSAMGARNDEEKAQSAKIAESSMSKLAGTMSFQWSLDTGLESIAGVLDPAGLQELWKSEDYAAAMKRASEVAGNAEATLNTDAGEHRGVNILEMRVEYDTPEDMPFVEDGIMITSNAIVGDSFVSTSMARSQASLKGLIDLVMDDQIEPTSIGQGVLANVRMGVAELIEWMAELQNAPFPVDDLPEQAHVTITKQGNGIAFHVVVR